MAILTGYQKVKKYVKESAGYRLLSLWTSAETVEIDSTTTLKDLADGLGDASKKDVDTSLTSSTTSTDVPTSKAVVDYIAGVGAMVFKGTIGTDPGDTATDLPTAAVAVGDTYKIATAGTYNSIVSKVGDLFVATSTTPDWEYIPAGDDKGGKMLDAETLAVGSTTVTFTDADITTSSNISVYTDTFGVNPTDVTVTNGSAVVTFEAQSNPVSVKLYII